MAGSEPDDAVLRVLGVASGADEATVKQAYRELAARHHPDRNPGDPEAAARFHEVTRAYAAWCEARGVASGPAAPSSGKPVEDVSQIFEQFQDLFGDFFGGKGAPPAPARGADRQQPLLLSYPEARDGCTRDVDVLRELVCRTCGGTGARDGVTQTCARCHGARTIRTTQGLLQLTETCTDCGGTGRYILEPCERCERGLRPIAETVEVRVPPGVETGTQLRLAGKGNEHPGGPPGDLYLAIEVDLLDALVPRGDDVVIETAVCGRHVLLGGPLEVRGLDGTVQVEVPRGVRNGDSVRVPGRGNIRAGGAGGGGPPVGDPYREVARGDQIVVFRVPPEAERARGTAIGLAAAAAAVLIAILAALLR